MKKVFFTLCVAALVACNNSPKKADNTSADTNPTTTNSPQSDPIAQSFFNEFILRTNLPLLKGNIKSITKTHYYMDKDGNGNMIKAELSDMDATLTFEFSPEGRILSFSSNETTPPQPDNYYYTGAQLDSIVHKYEDYDDNGNLKTTGITKISYQYDAQGYVVTEKNFTDGKYMGGYNYTHETTPSGVVITSSCDTDPDCTTALFYYNPSGQLYQREEINSSGKTIAIDNYTYDKQGKRTAYKNKRFNDDGSTSLTEILYTYDSHGNIATIQTTEQGTTKIEKITYDYDSQGNVIRQYNDDPNTPTIFEYSIKYY